MRSSNAFVAVVISLVLTLASFALITPTVNGPVMSTMIMSTYASEAAAWAGLIPPASAIDIMASGPSRFRTPSEDEPTGLTAGQFATWLSTPALQSAIDVRPERQLGILEFDFNCNETMDGLPGAIYTLPGIPNPTSDPLFRAAVAKLVDKTAIATTDFGGVLEILDVPLAPPFHNAYFNPAVIGANYAFKYNGAQAQADLTAAGYVLDTNTPNPFYPLLVGIYPWAVQYMRINALTGNPLTTDLTYSGGAVGLTIYSRSDKPELDAAGARLRDVLRASGIPVNFRSTIKATCERQVEWYFGYHIYTGAWKLDTDPDHLHDFYTSEFAELSHFNYMLFNGEGSAMPNGWRTKSTALETLLDDVKYAPNEAAMITAARNVQAALWGPTAGWLPPTGGMPSIILGHLSPLRTAYNRNWRGIVNMQGVGVGNWWSYVLGYNSVTPAVTTMNVGLPSDPTLALGALNPVIVGSTCSLMVLENIYDPLIGVDPFNIQVDVPTGLANNWVVGTWDDAGTTKTEVMFQLRSGLMWQPNVAITFPTGEGGDGGSEAANPTGTALSVNDVAFSWLYHQAQWGWFYSNCYQIVEVQTQNGPPVWPIPALVNVPGGSGLTATWTANAALAANDVVAKLNVLGSLALSWLGKVPILPMFIWQHVLDAYSFDPTNAGGVGVSALVGSGPWIFSSLTLGVSATLTANPSYFLTAGTPGSAADAFVRECFHRRGDAGNLGGSGPSSYDGSVSGFDLAYFARVFSSTPYTDYPMPNYWQDDIYPQLIRSPPQPPSPIPPFDGTGQESSDGINYGPIIAYPWQVRNPSAGPAYLYVDFNYDHYADAFDLSILAQYWGTDAGSGW